ncbi:putative ataxin-10-like [Homarus americanus]|uniref:Putative ataxin-10-like n=1 Tax=Homarus americanus TaxID=6706 RepID=A0A8J5JWZ8_HOMAM|nr:putative ataxin-10-like [Homarus americanus]
MLWACQKRLSSYTVAESVDLVDPIISCTQWTFRTADRDNKRVVLTEEDSHQNPLTTTENNNDCHKEVVETPEQDVLSDRNSHSEWKKAHSTLASACVTCLGNMVAANSLTRKLIWPHLLPVLRNNQVKVIVNKLLSLYVNESQYSCFVLFCLELLLCSKDIVEVSWSHLSGEQQLLCLDVLAAILTDTSQKRCEPLSTSTITFLVHFFKVRIYVYIEFNSGVSLGITYAEALAGLLIEMVYTVERRFKAIQFKIIDLKRHPQLRTMF